MPTPLPFQRPVVSDPNLNPVIQDIYNKLAQAQGAITTLQGLVVTLQQQVKALQNP